MKQQSFEDKVRDLVYHHEEAAPNVMDKVFEKRTPWYVLRNKLSLYKYRIAAAVALIAGLFLLFNPFGKPTTSENANTPVRTEQIAEPTTTPISKDTEQTEPVEHNVESHQSIAESSTSGNQPGVEVNPSYPTGGSTTPVESTGSNPTNDVTEDPTSPSQPDGTVPSGGEVVSSDDADVGKDEPTKDPVKPNTDEGSVDKTNEGEIAQNDSDVTEEDKTPQDGDKTGEDIVVEDKTTDIADADQPTDSEGVNDVNEDEDPLGTTPATPIRKWSIGMSYGPSTGNRRFDNVGEASLINARNAAEKALYSNTAEVTLNYAATPNVDFYVGLNYFNRRERMNYVQTTTTTSVDVTSRQVVEYHPVLGPRTITVYDTVTNSVTVENNITSLNNYNHYIIPLGFRYTLYANKNLGIFINGNAGLEFMTRAKGQVLGANNELIDLSNFGRTQFGTSLSAGAGLALRMNDRMTALFEPRATFYLSPTNNQDYALNQWDQGYGFMVGLKYGL
jgi:hypothetical protein